MTQEKIINKSGSSAGLIGGRFIYWLNRYWMIVLSGLLGLLVGLPFLAPVFMNIGWDKPARFIYILYSLLCHQLPQRSVFLYGPKSMYTLAEIQVLWQNTIDPHILRQYIGDPQVGWKVAWSDRMVSMYTSGLLFTWLWYPLRRSLKPLPFWGLILLLLPMGIDGGTHLISDLSGIGQGFRDSNLWLAKLTGNVFVDSFYSGDALGSFNSWMRLLTGVLFGMAIAWFSLPYLETSYKGMADDLGGKFEKLDIQNQAIIEEIFSK